MVGNYYLLPTTYYLNSQASRISHGLDTMKLTKEQYIRYSRQMILPELQGEGQEKIFQAKVLLVGLGGLGSPQALYLAAAGVGTLGLLDGDRVDLTNLQRQVVHSTDDLGSPKVISAQRRIRAINPEVEVRTHDERLTSENAIGILSEYDIIVDCTDNFPARYLMNDACVLLGKPLVHGLPPGPGGALLSLSLPCPSFARHGAVVRRIRGPGRPARCSGFDPGHGGDQAHPGSWKAADRAASVL